MILSRKKLTTLILCCLANIIQVYSQKNTLFAGISRTNITPSSKEILGSKTVHDSLYAKTIILDNQKNKVAFILLDSQGVAQFIIEEAKKRIHQQTGFPIENIVISSTHTHSGIIAQTSPENFKQKAFTTYQEFLISKLSQSIIEANKTLTPVKIASGSIEKPEHVFNRRWYTTKTNVNPLGGKDSVKMNPGSKMRDQLIKPAGPTDPEVSFIAINKLDNTPFAVLANYSLHYVGGVKQEELSADYYGVFDTELNKALNNNKINPNFIAIMSNGTSGDVNNNDYSKPLPSHPKYEKMNMVAKDIAKAVAKEYSNLEFSNWIPINVAYKEIDLHKRQVDKQINGNLKKINANKSSKAIFNSNEKYYATRVKYLTNTYPSTIKIPLQAIQLGDVAISTIPFEVFAETGLDLKNKNPFSKSFTMGLANGHWGYLPTPEQHKKGGYETWMTVNRVEKNASNIISNELLKMLRNLR